MPIERDTVFGGRYVVQSQVGTGGMATVYRGLDQRLNRLVAIKVMLPRYAQDPTFAARFKQEAQAAAALQSPYIVGVYDWGKEGDTYYIIMEYLRGTDLKTGIRTHGAIAPRKVAQIGAQVCSALAVAHRHEIIHRDIKPQNIMIQPNGDAKVMDFGIARAKSMPNLTQTNSVLGTAHYVSPEQAQGKELDATSDLYSLGVVMYEAATGKLPFDGDDAVSVALKQVNEEPVPPSEVNPNVPDDFEAIILKCMAKDPADRFQSADELRHVLNSFIAGRPTGLDGANRTTVIGANKAATTTVMNGGGRPTAQMRAVGTAQTLRRQQQAAQMQRSYTAQQPVRTAAMQQRGGNGAGGGRGAGGSDNGLSGGAIFGIVMIALVLVALIVLLAMGVSNCSGSSNPTKNAGTASSTTDSNSASSEQVDVPSVTNLTISQATNKLNDYDLSLGTQTSQASTTVAKGQIISQSPEAGTKAAKGTAVNVVVSSGPDNVSMPAASTLKGKSEDEFKSALSALGLTAEHDESMDTYSDDVDEGQVCTWSNMNSTSVAKGSTIKYGLSKGPDTVTVPNLYQWGYDDAKAELESLGLVFAEAWEYSNDVSQYLAIYTDPINNTEVTRGSTVTVHFSNGPNYVTVPDVSGYDESSAYNTLGGYGFYVNTQYISESTVSSGRVVYTSPSAGSSSTSGSTVTIYVSTGPSTTTVPSGISSWSASSVAEALANAGLTSSVATISNDGSHEEGAVAYLDPGEGSTLTVGSNVTIYVYGAAAQNTDTGGDTTTTTPESE